MTYHVSILVLPATLLALSPSVLARQLPYNPTTLIRGGNDGVYVLNPNASPQFAVYNTSSQINSGDPGTLLADTLPFLKNRSRPFAPSLRPQSILVTTGDCSDSGKSTEVWEYSWKEKAASWVQQQTSSTSDTPSTSSVNFLSSTVTYDATNSTYAFGGMCPISDNPVTSWTNNATYSNKIVSTSQQESSSTYRLSTAGERAPPISEAGQTWTPLLPTLAGKANSSRSTVQQQNFVLLGGHTRTAFINMSQVALFSLPEQSWAFLGVNQPNMVNVEPRSGHTAVLTEDGTQIVVLGGWVGDVSNPATPQMAILNVGQGYGGSGPWSWAVPSQANSPFTNTQGVYGHGAVMLSDDIMMIAGGFSITKAKLSKRDSTTIQFYNVRTNEWKTTYSPPPQASQQSRASNSTARAGLGAGLGVGVTVLFVVAIVAIWYIRRRKQRKLASERHLRAMALGIRSYSNIDLASNGTYRHGKYPEMRSASWGARQERLIGDNLHEHLDTAYAQQHEPSHQDDGRHGTQGVSNLHHGLRQNPYIRSTAGQGGSFAAPGAVFTIDEVEEERSQRGSTSGQKGVQHPGGPNDPFGDSNEIQPRDEAALRRRKEVEGWVEGWASAAEALHSSHTPSKVTGRTKSNLSGHPSSNGGQSENCTSPTKSDRTGSDLSDRSKQSGSSRTPSAAGTLARTISQRSVSAGYALFTGAASAMARVTGASNAYSVDRHTSKRSISTGDLGRLASRNRSNSTEQRGYKYPPPVPVHYQSTANTHQASPESPIKDYKYAMRDRSASLTSQSRKALGVLTNATRRVLTGTGHVDVHSRIDQMEEPKESPTKSNYSADKVIRPTTARSTSASTQFWRQQQGPQDWQDKHDSSRPDLSTAATAGGSSSIRRRSGKFPLDKTAAAAGAAVATTDDAGSFSDDNDWDIETAVQQRVVQVMFSVPKEKLRVVNADSMSLISQSETNTSSPPDSPPTTRVGNGDRTVSGDNNNSSSSSGKATSSNERPAEDLWSRNALHEQKEKEREQEDADSARRERAKFIRRSLK